MTIEYDYNNSHLVIRCEGCAEIAEFDGDLKFCIAEAKAAGWKFDFNRSANRWLHYCSGECKGES